MARAPLLGPALALIAGILADLHALTVPALCCALAGAALRRELGVALACGLLASALHGHPFVVEHALREARYAGTVTGDVRRDEDVVSFAFAVDGFGTLRAHGRGNVHAGERLFVRGRIAPLDEARNPGEPSARAIGLDDGLTGELAVDRILRRAAPDLRDPRVWGPLVRERASAAVRAALPEPEATILAGALWGERGTLPRDVRDDFQATGTVHVLVTAGLHLGVIAALVAAILALLRVPRVAASLATIPIIYAYAWVSGWHLPSQRAAAMLAVALIARAAGARTVSLNTLALAAMVVAVSWPVAVESVSFALSFSCVAAIVLFAAPIAERLRTVGLPDRIGEALALTASTQIGVWPLTAATFFTVAPYAMLANAVVVPLVGLTMTLGIATIVLHPVPLLAPLAVRLETWLLTIILGVTHLIAGLPGARLTMTPPPAWSIAAYDACAVVAAAMLRGGKFAAAAALVFAACAGVWLTSIPRPTGTLTVTMLDVGQADAIVVRTPSGHTILIDTGGRLERGPTIDGQSPAERAADRVVIPYLRRAGISRIDLMILTHPHGDHVGGFAGIVRAFRVNLIFDSGQHYGGRAFNDGIREAAVRRVPIHIVRCGEQWTADDGVRFSILSPCGALLADGKNDVNENSIVAMLQYNSFRMLFTGDAGFQTEERLLIGNADLRADILKVGHHGSAYASGSAFLAAVRPRIALISVGRHNLFGHPAASTVADIVTAGSRIYRTDVCGAILVSVSQAATVHTLMPCETGP
ncbi:MAG: DNA internalization-related competence protein ComEC/Rec2 [Candidatus Velthaea sp.]